MCPPPKRTQCIGKIGNLQRAARLFRFFRLARLGSRAEVKPRGGLVQKGGSRLGDEHPEKQGAERFAASRPFGA